uniref:Uncharacterized protein n=1 Tax=Panagrellus redivivus TaxID=6233 RepID=A0A7E4ZWD9_PANRE
MRLRGGAGVRTEATATVSQTEQNRELTRGRANVPMPSGSVEAEEWEVNMYRDGHVSIRVPQRENDFAFLVKVRRRLGGGDHPEGWAGLGCRGHSWHSSPKKNRLPRPSVGIAECLYFEEKKSFGQRIYCFLSVYGRLAGFPKPFL